MTTALDTHRAKVRVVAGPTLQPIAGSFTLDDSWAPYVQADLDCALLEGDELLSIDPRAGGRVRAQLRQSFGTSETGDALTALFTGLDGGDITSAWTGLSGAQITAMFHQPFNAAIRSPTVKNFDLSIRSRQIDEAAHTVRITLASDEALLQDYALVATSPYLPASTSIRDLVNYVLALIGRRLEADALDGVIVAESSTWRPGISAWSYLEPLVQAAGLRLWCDESRRWHLDLAESTVSGTVTLRSSGTMINSEDTIDRDGEWYDAVVITYEWIDDLGASHEAYDIASENDFSKVFAVTYPNTPYPGPGAAAGVLRRARGRGRAQQVRAISSYRPTPGMLATIQTEASQQTGYLSSIRWSIGDAEMEIKTRGLLEVPEYSWLDDTAGVSWLDLAVGIDWSEDI